MKLLFAVTTTLFATSASAKMGEQRSLHAKVDALESEVAELKALLMGASHAAPQGKKNLRRALEGDLVIDSNATTTEEDGTPEEKADALVAQYGFSNVLKKILVDLDPVYNCLGFDKDTQTCSLGSDDIDFVNILAEQDIDIFSVEGGDINIDAEEGDVDIDAGNSEDGGNVEIHAEQGNNDGVDGSVLIKGNTGSIEITSDDGILITADDDISLNSIGSIQIDATDDLFINAASIEIDGDDSVDIIAGDNVNGTVIIKSAGDIDIKAGVNADDDVVFTGGNVNIKAFTADNDSFDGDVSINASSDVNIKAESAGIGITANDDIVIQSIDKSVHIVPAISPSPSP